MRTIKAIILAFAIIASAIHAKAIEHLQISVQCTNVVLRWPCLDDGSEQFIVQYRSTLSPTDSWQTLETSLPATYGTNEMYYTNYGVVLNPVNCDGGGSFSMMMMGGGEMSLSASQPSEPMATPNSGGAAAPVKLYPEGFDFSNFTITVPGTSGSLSGMQFMAADSGSPLDPSGGGAAGDGDTNSIPPDVGFYRVVRNGAHMFGVTNGAVWSGKVSVPLEVANPDGNVISIAIEAVDPNTGNAAPIGNSQQIGPFNAPLSATVDTTVMSNGVYNLQAYAHWEDGSGSGEWEAISPPVSVTTSNEITFENFMPQFGDPNDVADFGATNYSLVFNATSAHTNVNWTVDFYDSSSNYVGSVSGNSPDGNISFTWDLTDALGVAHTNDAFFSSYISTDYIDPPAPTFWKNSDPWTGPGQWAIACQHVFETPYYNILPTESDEIYNEMDEFVSRAGGNGGLSSSTPANQSDGSAYAINGGSVGGAVNWTAFRAAIYAPRTRNLVYFGHGGPTGLGWTSNNTSVFIPVTEIASRLGNMNGTNGHAFRFAFIDACDTANGNLCSALGIMQKKDVRIETYTTARIRPGTYCGWPTAKWIAEVLGGSANHDHINYMTHLQHIWYFYPQTIQVAAIQAAGFNDAYGMLNNDLVINGYWNLLPTAYNH
jgi:hypothetical protein